MAESRQPCSAAGGICPQYDTGLKVLPSFPWGKRVASLYYESIINVVRCVWNRVSSLEEISRQAARLKSVAGRWRAQGRPARKPPQALGGGRSIAKGRVVVVSIVVLSKMDALDVDVFVRLWAQFCTTYRP